MIITYAIQYSIQILNFTLDPLFSICFLITLIEILNIHFNKSIKNTFIFISTMIRENITY